MSEELEELARLVHDVGKYVSRTAKNLPEGDIPEVLVTMLVRDLYAIDGTRTASVVFEERARAVRGHDEALQVVRAALSEIDARQEEVRRGEPSAVRRAAALACEVERTLRVLARAATAPTDGGAAT